MPESEHPASPSGPVDLAREPSGGLPGRSLRTRSLPAPRGRRATVIGAGSFGTALAVVLTRGGLRVTLQARTAAQAARLDSDRENRVYLPGVELPSQLRIEAASAGVARADYVFLAVPSRGLDAVIGALVAGGLSDRAAIVSVAKGMVPPDGIAPTVMLSEAFGPGRVGCVGGPAHAREMVHDGAGLVAASGDEELAHMLAQVFIRAGVVCELSNDPIGVELAGAAKNAAALAAGATEAQGLNAAGAAAGHIFAEVWRFAEAQGARPGVDDRPGRRRRPGRHGARAPEPQPPRRRAAGGRRVRARHPRAHRPSRGSAGIGAPAGGRAGARGGRGAGHHGARTTDLRRDAPRRVGGAGARHRPASGPLAPAPAGVSGAALGSACAGVFSRGS